MRSPVTLGDVAGLFFFVRHTSFLVAWLGYANVFTQPRM